MNFLISVIVPCYNVEKYLRKCVESIIAQTYTNLEILLIDDGSPDDSGQICDEYAAKDSRIKVIHKKNGGLSEARNVAIDMAKGEYFTFVDSDDYVTNDYVESLCNLIVENSTQISVTCPNSFYENSKPQNISKKKIAVKFFNVDTALQSMFYQRDFDTTAWAKMYHRSLFEGIRYPEGWLYEDLATTYRLMLRCNKVAFSSYRNYFYLLRKTSIEGAPFTLQKYEDCLKIVNQLEEDKILMSRELKKALNCRIVSFIFHILLEVPSEQKRIRSVLFDKVKDLRWRVMLDNKARKKTRLACLLSFAGMSVVDVFADKGKSRKQ